MKKAASFFTHSVVLALLFGSAFLISAAGPAAAQSAAESAATEAFEENLRKMNLSDPALNPRFQQPNWFLNREVLDDSQQVIGRVNDFLVDDGGEVRQMVANIDVPGSFRQTMYFDFTEVARQPISHVYELSYNRQVIVDELPQFLQSIETAASNGASVFSLKRATEDAALRDARGRKLADIKAVLMNDQGRFIQALLVHRIRGASSLTELAVPYNGDFMSAGERAGRIDFYMDPPYDEAFLEFASDFRRR